MDLLENGYDVGTFKLGQKVYSIKDKTHRFWIRKKCIYCDSTGKIFIKGKEFKCPECGGELNLKEVIEKIVNNTYEIKSITTFKNEENSLETYTDESTGCGVIIKKQDDGTSIFFGSKKEAQDACDKYNKENYVHLLLDEYKRQEVRKNI